MKRLQICMFDSDFYLQQDWILHLDVEVENVQLRKSTYLNIYFFEFEKMTFIWSKMTFTWSWASLPSRGGLVWLFVNFLIQ